MGNLVGRGEKYLARSEYTPLYEKGIKKTQKKPKEITPSPSKALKSLQFGIKARQFVVHTFH